MQTYPIQNSDQALNYYQILGIEPDATLSNILSALNQKLKIWTRDVEQTTTEQEIKITSEKYEKIMEAYNTLRDDNKRAEYDREIYLRKLEQLSTNDLIELARKNRVRIKV